jgi:cytochrome P450
LESLRLHPSVPTLIRFAVEDIECPEGEIIRKGDGVIIYCYGLSRLPNWFENPTQFNPLRFFNQEKVFDPSHYPYFNIMPRLCLGKHVALMEAKIAIAKILVKYKLQLN